MKLNIIQPLKVKNCIISHQINSYRINELSEKEELKFNTVQSQEEKKITINPKKARECLFNKKQNIPRLKLVQLSPENLPKVKQTSLIFFQNEIEKEVSNTYPYNNFNYNSNYEPFNFKPIKKTVSVAELIHMIKEKLNRKEHVDHLIGQFKALQSELTEISQENKRSRNFNRDDRALTENLSTQPHFLKSFMKSNIESMSNSPYNGKKLTRIFVKNNNDQMYQMKKYPKLCLMSNEALSELKNQKSNQNSKKINNFNSSKSFSNTPTMGYQLVNSKITLPIMGKTQHSYMKKLYVKTNKNDLDLNSEFYSKINAKALTTSKFGSSVPSVNLYNTMDPCGSLYNDIKIKSKVVIQTKNKIYNNLEVDI